MAHRQRRQAHTKARQLSTTLSKGHPCRQRTPRPDPNPASRAPKSRLHPNLKGGDPFATADREPRIETSATRTRAALSS